MDTGRNLIRRVCLSGLALFAWAGVAEASITNWINTSVGDWFISSNWNAGVPGDGAEDGQIGNGTAFINCSANPGARVNNLYVGAYTPSGTLLVSGTPSAPPSPGTIGGGLHLGNLFVGLGDSTASGTGTMTISSGGLAQGFGYCYSLNSCTPPVLAYIGSGTHATGTITSTDAGSLLSVNTIFVGSDTSVGTLNVQNGGAAEGVEGMVIGYKTGSNGSAQVTGAGSTLSVGSFNQSGLVVGDGGAATLNVSAGGKVLSDSSTLLGAFIGMKPGPNASVIVTGANSSWIEQSSIYVGANNTGIDSSNHEATANGGTGILRILSGGLVQCSHLQASVNCEVTIDNGSSTTAGLVVTGVGNTLGHTGTAGDIFIGSNAAGRMEVKGSSLRDQNGNPLRSGGTVWGNRGLLGFGAAGSALVTNPGSTWTNSGALYVGGFKDGTLDVTDEGVVTSGADSFIGYSSNVAGNANISGAGSSWSVAGNLYIGGSASGAGGTGTLQLENGGALTANAATVYSNGYLNLNANPVLKAPLTFLGGAIQFVTSDNTTFPNDFTIGAGGLRIYTYGHPSVLGGSITGAGGLTKGGGTQLGLGTLTLTGASNYAGATTLTTGALVVNGSITSAVTVNSGATLGGNGSVGNLLVNSGGIVAPGNSPGKLTVNGNYTQQSGSVLNIEIGGASPGIGGYDQVAVSGTATLGGTLNLSLVNGYRPAVGDKFAIITSSAETGSFATINSSGFTVSSSATGSGLQLTVTSVQPGVPVISSPTSASGTQDASFSYAIAASDSPTSFGAIGLPAGLSVNGTTGLISGTPTVSGTFSVTISATNSTGTGSAPLSLSISPAPPPPTPTPTPTPTPMPTPTTTPGILGNISTRLQVGTGNNVLFGGFIVGGSGTKKVLIRSAGPSLTQFGVPGVLANPQLELHDANQTIGTNDNWQTTVLGGVINADQTAEIQGSGAAPSDPAEPAIIATLSAGTYTAIVSGVNNTQGVATVEVYDLTPNNGATLANISTRGFIQTGDNVMIGGFIVVTQPIHLLVRATGPSLSAFGIDNALVNPQLELHDSNGVNVGNNDDWQTTRLGGIITTDQSAAIGNSGLAPSNVAESAIMATLAPGNYTAIAQGAGGTSGVGLIEVYTIP